MGGENTHCVVSGHCGLPDAKLFTDLYKMQKGDVFHLYVLDEVLTYQVTDINVVLPDDVSSLLIQDGKDMCTLMTCTPYGVNSHYLLVHGTRIETVEASEEVSVTNDGFRLAPTAVVPAVVAPVLIGLLINLMIPIKRKG